MTMMTAVMMRKKGQLGSLSLRRPVTTVSPMWTHRVAFGTVLCSSQHTEGAVSHFTVSCGWQNQVWGWNRASRRSVERQVVLSGLKSNQ